MKIRPLKNKSGRTSAALKWITSKQVDLKIVHATGARFLKAQGVKNPGKLLGTPK